MLSILVFEGLMRLTHLQILILLLSASYTQFKENNLVPCSNLVITSSALLIAKVIHDLEGCFESHTKKYIDLGGIIQNLIKITILNKVSTLNI